MKKDDVADAPLADLPLLGPVRPDREPTQFRDIQDLMVWPCFPLTATPPRQRIEITAPRGDRWVTIEPGPKGAATIFDADVLIYLVSELKRARDRGLDGVHRLMVPGYDLLRTIRRDTSARSYDFLRNALVRLQTTTVRTNAIVIPPAGDPEPAIPDERVAQFSWLAGWGEQRKLYDNRGNRPGRSKGFELTVDATIYHLMGRDQKLLRVDPRYFDLRGGLERQLYRIARKHAGHDTVSIGLAQLRFKCGHRGDARAFRRSLSRIIEADALPEYALVWQSRDVVRMFLRDHPRAKPRKGTSVRPASRAEADAAARALAALPPGERASWVCHARKLGYQGPLSDHLAVGRFLAAPMRQAGLI